MATVFSTPQMLRTRADTELTLEEVGLLVLGAIRDSLSRSVYSVREDELVSMLLRQHPYLARRGIQVRCAFKTCSLLRGSQFAQGRLGGAQGLSRTKAGRNKVAFWSLTDTTVFSPSAQLQLQNELNLVMDSTRLVMLSKFPEAQLYIDAVVQNGLQAVYSSEELQPHLTAVHKVFEERPQQRCKAANSMRELLRGSLDCASNALEDDHWILDRLHCLFQDGALTLGAKSPDESVYAAQSSRQLSKRLHTMDSEKSKPAKRPKKLNITIAPETEQFLSTPQDGVNVMYTHWLAGNPQTHSFTVSNEMQLTEIEAAKIVAFGEGLHKFSMKNMAAGNGEVANDVHGLRAIAATDKSWLKFFLHGLVSGKDAWFREKGSKRVGAFAAPNSAIRETDDREVIALVAAEILKKAINKKRTQPLQLLVAGVLETHSVPQNVCRLLAQLGVSACMKYVQSKTTHSSCLLMRT